MYGDIVHKGSGVLTNGLCAAPKAPIWQRFCAKIPMQIACDAYGEQGHLPFKVPGSRLPVRLRRYDAGIT